MSTESLPSVRAGEKDDDAMTAVFARLSTHDAMMVDVQDDVIIHDVEDAQSTMSSAMLMNGVDSDRAWNANELFAQKSEQISLFSDIDFSPLCDNDFSASALTLIRKLVDMGTLYLDAKTAAFLDNEAVLLLFMSQMSRLPSNASTIFPTTIDERVVRERDRDITDTIYSYRLIDILCCGSVNNSKMVEKHLNLIITALFDLFLPDSNGNFHHFRQVFESFMHRFPSQLYDVTLNNKSSSIQNTKPLIFRMIHYLHDSAVQTALITWLTFSPKSSPLHERAKRFGQLQTLKFTNALVDVIESNLSELMTGLCEFLSRLVEELISIEHSNLLFLSLAVDKTIVARLMDICRDGSPQQRQTIITLLNLIVVKSMPRPLAINSFKTMSVDKVFYLVPTATGTADRLANHLSTLCSLAINTTLSTEFTSSNQLKLAGYTIQKPFTRYRLMLLEIIYEVLWDEKRKETRNLEDIPPLFWTTLVDWFFEYRFNSLFQTLFYKFCVTAANVGHVQTLQNLYSHTNLLNRIIGCYNDEATVSDMQGHIVLICNTLRLMDEATNDSNSPIRELLNAHPQWKTFVPKLCAITAQQTFVPSTFVQLPRKPLPHFGPLNVNYVFEELYSGFDPQTGPKVMRLSDKAANGVHLGSKYAICLGFTQRLNQEYKDESSSVINTKLDESLDIESKSSARRKRSRNKKRAKSERETNSTDATAIVESHDDDDNDGDTVNMEQSSNSPADNNVTATTIESTTLPYPIIKRNVLNNSTNREVSIDNDDNHPTTVAESKSPEIIVDVKTNTLPSPPPPYISRRTPPIVAGDREVDIDSGDDDTNNKR